MTNQQHPITPPPELCGRWYDESPYDDELGLVEHVATQAARWGADQELDACCEWAFQFNYDDYRYQDELRALRRPKPPNLKAQALQAWAAVEAGTDDQTAMAVIRRALEQLDD